MPVEDILEPNEEEQGYREHNTCLPAEEPRKETQWQLHTLSLNEIVVQNNDNVVAMIACSQGPSARF